MKLSMGALDCFLGAQQTHQHMLHEVNMMNENRSAIAIHVMVAISVAS